jgi:hypothetical protein
MLLPVTFKVNNWWVLPVLRVEFPEGDIILGNTTAHSWGMLEGISNQNPSILGYATQEPCLRNGKTPFQSESTWKQDEKSTMRIHTASLLQV